MPPTPAPLTATPRTFIPPHPSPGCARLSAAGRPDTVGPDASAVSPARLEALDDQPGQEGSVVATGQIQNPEPDRLRAVRGEHVVDLRAEPSRPRRVPRGGEALPGLGAGVPAASRALAELAVV